MLIKFTIGNCLSFKDRFTFDLSAEALKEKKGSIHVPYLHNPKLFILKSAAIYGFNAFGKSNLLKAYASFRQFILQSFTLGATAYETEIEPFRLNTLSIQQPTFFETVFVLRHTKYRFGFEIADQKVKSEWLYYADGIVRENVLYHRIGQDFEEVSKSWNKQSGNRVEQTKLFTKSNNLFLSVLLSQEGVPRVDEIANWFRGNIVLTGDYSSAVNGGAAQIYTNEEYRSIILKFLDNADLGFSNVFERVSNLVTKSGYQSELIDILFENQKANFELFTSHQVFNEKKVLQKTIEFQLLKNESSGAIKYFIVACFLAYGIRKGQLIWIDELDASIDSRLLLFLVDLYNDDKNNVSGSQVIFTAHNTVFLDKNLRRDQLWFVDKNEFGESSLHKGHTPESPIRVDKSIEADYRSGKLKRGISRKINRDNLPSLFDQPTE